MIKRMIVMLLSVGVVLGAVYGFQILKSRLIAKALSDYASAPQTVASATVAFQDWQPLVKAVGTLRASQGVVLAPEVPGVVDDIAFRSGQDVTAGTILLRLQLADAPARLKQLQAMADLAEVTYQRDLRQLREKAVSQATVDADLANLKSARAQVDAQQALIEQKTLRAPFTGRLGIRMIDKGQYLNPGASVVTLQALDPLVLDFHVPQQDIARVALNQRVVITVDGWPNKTFEGTVTAINPRVDVGSRNLLVRASLSNPDGKLLPGMYATLDLWTGVPKKLLTLPLTAVTFNPFGSTVFIIDDAKPGETAKDAKGKPVQRVHQAIVKTGPSRGDQVAITGGLTEGQVVVSAGQMKLRNGTAVSVDNSVQPSASATPALAPQ